MPAHRYREHRPATGPQGPQPLKPSPAQTSTQAARYSLEEWMVPAQDTKGHSARVWIRVPPSMDRDMEIMFQSKRFPYRTQSDMLRHAIYRHLVWLHGLEGDLPKTFLVALRSASELLRDDEYKTETEGVLTKLSERVQHYLDRGDTPEALRVLAAVQQELKSITDCAWKRKMLEKIARQYGQYLPKTPFPGGEEGR